MESAFFTKKPEMKRKIESYGLKSKRAAPSDPDLMEFERQLYEMVRNVKFKRVKMTELEKHMKNTLKVVKQKGKVVVRSDKTNNHYLISPEE